MMATRGHEVVWRGSEDVCVCVCVNRLQFCRVAHIKQTRNSAVSEEKK